MKRSAVCAPCGTCASKSTVGRTGNDLFEGFACGDQLRRFVAHGEDHVALPDQRIAVSDGTLARNDPGIRAGAANRCGESVENAGQGTAVTKDLRPYDRITGTAEIIAHSENVMARKTDQRVAIGVCIADW